VTCEHVELFVAADIYRWTVGRRIVCYEKYWEASRTMCIKYSICFIVFGNIVSSFYVIVRHAKHNCLDLQLPNGDCAQCK